MESAICSFVYDYSECSSIRNRNVVLATKNHSTEFVRAFLSKTITSDVEHWSERIIYSNFVKKYK